MQVQARLSESRWPLKRAVRTIVLAMAVLAVLATATSLPAQQQGSGLKLPRFASLAAERINVRTGPGKQYPIRWVYARNGLPVKITGEFDTWRKIEDHEGDQGWVHVSLLSGRRTVMVTGSVRELRRLPEPDARVVLRAEAGVIGRLQQCGGAWCEVEIAGTGGWIGRDAVWGLLPGDSGS